MAIFQPRRREDLVQRLATMDLALWAFENAIARGVAESMSYTEGAPKSGPEIGRWLRTVEEFHHGLISLQSGWERPDTDPMNLPTWYNPQKHLAIVTSSGNENTGERTFNPPSNRNPKGLSFGNIVAANSRASLFDAVSAAGELVDVDETWVFLYDARQGFVYSELSLPILMDRDRILDWRDRILLPRFDPTAGTFEPARDDDPEQDFGFTIGRR